MKRRIIASAGDVKLKKFIVIPTEYLGPFHDMDYDEILGGYIDIWSYTYNKLTYDVRDMEDHSDHIDALPFELRKLYRQVGYWGKTDIFKDNIRFYVNNNESLSAEQLTYLQQLCR